VTEARRVTGATRERKAIQDSPALLDLWGKPDRQDRRVLKGFKVSLELPDRKAL
jgi:hypothetical protein